MRCYLQSGVCVPFVFVREGDTAADRPLGTRDTELHFSQNQGVAGCSEDPWDGAEFPKGNSARGEVHRPFSHRSWGNAVSPPPLGNSSLFSREICFMACQVDLFVFGGLPLYQ